MIDQYPFGVGFQLRVIAAALVDRGWLARSAGRAFRAEYFADPAAAALSALLLDFWQRQRAVPSRELFVDLVAEDVKRRKLRQAESAGLIEASVAVADVPAADALYALGRVEEWVKTQTLAAVAVQIAQLHDEATRTGEAKTDAMVRLVTEASRALAQRGADWLDYWDDLVPRVYANPRDLKVTTGYSTLDEALDGGVDGGELFVFLGGPSMGKTSLLVGAARGALLQRLRPLVVTNEVSPRKWAARVDRAITGMTREEIQLHPRRAIKAVQRLRQVRGRMIIKGFPTGQATVADIRQVLDDLRDREDFVADVVIVDYADELRSERYADDYRLGVVDVYKSLRAQAQDLGVPVFTASQANRQAENKKIVRMADFAEAYAKAAVADIVVAQCQTEEEAAMTPYPVSRLYGAKYREGKRRFNLPFYFRADRGIIVPAEDITDPVEEVVTYGGARA